MCVCIHLFTTMCKIDSVGKCIDQYSFHIWQEVNKGYEGMDIVR